MADVGEDDDYFDDVSWAHDLRSVMSHVQVPKLGVGKTVAEGKKGLLIRG